MLCQRQLGTLPSFSPFHLTPFLGGLVSRLAPRPTLWSVCYGRFIVFLVLLSLNLSTFVVRSFSCLLLWNYASDCLLLAQSFYLQRSIAYFSVFASLRLCLYPMLWEG